MISPSNTKGMRAATRRAKGFTVAEALLLFLFVSVLVVLLVPRLNFARGRSAQRAALVDLDIWSDAVADYAADHGGPPPNPHGPLHFRHPVLPLLTPYLRAVRVFDLWGYFYRLWTGPGDEAYGLVRAAGDYLVATYGFDGVPESWTYDPVNPGAGFFEPRTMDDIDRDIVIRNGVFIRRPR